MEELKQWYRDSLADRIQALEAPLGQIAAEGSTESEETIRGIAHSLRGSGATYGFPEITKAAAQVEDSESADIAPKTKVLIEILRNVASGG